MPYHFFGFSTVTFNSHGLNKHVYCVASHIPYHLLQRKRRKHNIISFTVCLVPPFTWLTYVGFFLKIYLVSFE